MSLPPLDWHRDGARIFPREAAVEGWARAVAPLAEALERDPAHAEWWRCNGTWFAGVNVLPNGPDGAVPAWGVPPLEGAAMAFLRDLRGPFALDAGQVSTVTPGYPRHGEEDTEAAWRYRVRRRAAHVDGLERDAARRRRLSETHGFVLGIPLGDETGGAFTLWRGSHEVMRAAFREALNGTPVERWREVDVTDAYTAARARCFEECEPMEIAPGLGASYAAHPLALHGVAPWEGEGGGRRPIAYFRPDPFAGDPEAWLAS